MGEELTPPDESRDLGTLPPDTGVKTEALDGSGTLPPVVEGPTADEVDRLAGPSIPEEVATPEASEPMPIPIHEATSQEEHRDRATRKAAISTLRNRRDYQENPSLRNVGDQLDRTIREGSEPLRSAGIQLEFVMEDFKKGQMRDGHFFGSSDSLIASLERLHKMSGSEEPLFDDGYSEITSKLRYGTPSEKEAAMRRLEETADSVFTQAERQNTARNIANMRKFAEVARRSPRERYDRDPNRYKDMPVSEFVESMPEYYADISEVQIPEVWYQCVKKVYEELESIELDGRRTQELEEFALNTSEILFRQAAGENAVAELQVAGAEQYNSVGQDLVIELFKDVIPNPFDKEKKPNAYNNFERMLQTPNMDQRELRYVVSQLLSDPTRPALDQFKEFVERMKTASEKLASKLDAKRQEVDAKWGAEPKPEKPDVDKSAEEEEEIEEAN